MQTDSHIEVVSPDRYYDYSRHTERIFCNYESPCQTRTHPMLATSPLHYNIRKYSWPASASTAFLKLRVPVVSK